MSSDHKFTASETSLSIADKPQYLFVFQKLKFSLPPLPTIHWLVLVSEINTQSESLRPCDTNEETERDLCVCHLKASARTGR